MAVDRNKILSFTDEQIAEMCDKVYLIEQEMWSIEFQGEARLLRRVIKSMRKTESEMKKPRMTVHGYFEGC